MNKNYFGYSYSPRRSELYFYDKMKNKQIFIYQELCDEEDRQNPLNGIGKIVEAIELDKDEDEIKDMILDIFGYELDDLIGSTEYYNKVVNPNDSDYYDKVFKISLYNYDNIFFYILGNCEQDALDILIDLLESKGETGHLNKIIELEKDYSEEEIENSFVVAGNSCYYINSEHLFIKEI